MINISTFDELLKVSKNISYFSTINSVLNWDNQTYLPNKAASYRAQQFAFIEEQIINIFTSNETKSLVSKLEKEKSSFSDFEKRNAEVFLKAYHRRTAVPKEILIENKKQESETFAAWQKAKKTNNYKLYAPELAKNIVMKQKVASFIDKEKIPFDVHLDQHEPGFSSKKMNKIFSDLKPKLISLLNKIQSSHLFDDLKVTSFPMDRSIQEKMVYANAKFIGYDLEAGRIDQGEHPMTFRIISPTDVRFTVNYHENNFLSALFAGFHEAGHAIHSQNTNPEFSQYPISMFGGSAGISESQSRFFENLVGRSPSLWPYYLPKFNKLTNQKLELRDFLLAMNKVQLSKIRIEADELTYPLHIILRFEIEQGMLDGTYNVNELPAIWNEKMKESFDIDIEKDSEGIMQDIHWASSFYGYFPTYALGNLYNAQMLHAMKKELDFDNLLLQGNVTPIREWLITNVHKKTGFYDPEEFLRVISGKDINPDYFVKYLDEKYTKLQNM